MIARLQNAIGVESIHTGDFERARLAFLDARNLFQRAGAQREIADSMGNLGRLAFRQGNFREARLHFSESLQLYHQIGDSFGIAEGLVSTGNLVAARGSFEVFSQLLGIAEAFVPDIQKQTWSFVRKETEQNIKTARAVLGEEGYTAGYEAGKQMSLDEAVTFALKEMEH